MDLEPPAVQRAAGGANLLRGDWREEVEEGVKERENLQKHTRPGDAGTDNLSRIVATWVHKQK